MIQGTQIWTLLKTLLFIDFCYIRRESNHVMNSMAKLAFNLDLGDCWFAEILDW